MNKSAWNSAIIQNSPTFGAFLQSYEWGEFQQAIGREVSRIHASVGNKPIFAQAIKMPLPFGRFYHYIPKGPLGDMDSNLYLPLLSKNFQESAFVRLEPCRQETLLAVKEVQPATTTAINLTQSEDQILDSMKPKTRYNVRLANKKGVEYKIHSSLDAFEDFWRLMEQTSVRDKFKSHTKAYYETLLKSIGQKGDVIAFLATAEYSGRVLVANIIIDFGDTRTYLHGATSNLHRNVMAQYGLHYFLIQDAKKKGMKKFDFWGIAPENAGSNHPWFGITRYKTGFGGEIISMPGTYDFVRQPLFYGFYKAAKEMRRFL
jgi:peptidoglycan pentaglycine glycine transferase (the first glycine)